MTKRKKLAPQIEADTRRVTEEAIAAAAALAKDAERTRELLREARTAVREAHEAAVAAAAEPHATRREFEDDVAEAYEHADGALDNLKIRLEDREQKLAEAQRVNARLRFELAAQLSVSARVSAAALRGFELTEKLAFLMYDDKSGDGRFAFKELAIVDEMIREALEDAATLSTPAEEPEPRPEREPESVPAPVVVGAPRSPRSGSGAA